MDKDDGVREGMTAKALSALKPVFKRNGTTTAGNSSQVRFRAKLGRWKAFCADSGCIPHVHGFSA